MQTEIGEDCGDDNGRSGLQNGEEMEAQSSSEYSIWKREFQAFFVSYGENELCVND